MCWSLQSPLSLSSVSLPLPRPALTGLACVVLTADCETDGYLSSSGLQDPLESLPLAASPQSPCAPVQPSETPPVNTPPMPALRFPSVGRVGWWRLRLQNQPAFQLSIVYHDSSTDLDPNNCFGFKHFSVLD